jgi:hypothetical protein
MKYRYKGPISAVSLNHGNKTEHHTLVPGAILNLPETHEYVKNLCELGHLEPIAGEPKAVVPAATKPEKGVKDDR